MLQRVLGLHYWLAMSSLKAGQHLENIVVFNAPEQNRGGDLAIYAREMFLLKVKPTHCWMEGVGQLWKWTRQIYAVVELQDLTGVSATPDICWNTFTALGGNLSGNWLYSQLADGVSTPRKMWTMNTVYTPPTPASQKILLLCSHQGNGRGKKETHSTTLFGSLKFQISTTSTLVLQGNGTLHCVYPTARPAPSPNPVYHGMCSMAWCKKPDTRIRGAAIFQQSQDCCD